MLIMPITTDTIRQSIEFALSEERIKRQIQRLEENPSRFIILEITSTVISYPQSIIRVIINFNERGNPNNFREDTQLDIQGTALSNFRILNLIANEI
jgi:hypothetical protein